MNKLAIIALILSFSLPAFAVTAYYKRESVSGMNKICYYDKLGSEVAITIAATKICPLTVNM